MRESPRTFLLGLGNVGLGLALAARRAGVPLVGVWNRGPERRLRAQSLLDVPVRAGPLASLDLHEVELVLCAVADDAVPKIGAELARNPTLPASAVVAHTCGALPAKALGVNSHRTLSVHPLVACPTPELAARELMDSFATLEGDPAAHAVGGAFVAAIGAKPLRVGTEHKARYHAAAVMASNLVVSLVAAAAREAQAAGLAEADLALLGLARTALDAAAQLGPTHGLTGPVARGDVSTVQAHLGALGPEAREIYRTLSRQALALATRRGLGQEQVSALGAVLGTS